MRNRAKPFLSLAVTVIALGAAVGQPVAAIAQTPTARQQIEQQEKQFETAVENHLRDINVLLRDKGAPQTAKAALTANVTIRNLISALRLYPPGTAVLFYSYG